MAIDKLRPGTNGTVRVFGSDGSIIRSATVTRFHIEDDTRFITFTTTEGKSVMMILGVNMGAEITYEKEKEDDD